MKKINTITIGLAAAAGLALGATAPAYAYPPGTKPAVSGSSTAKAGKSYTISGSKYKPGASQDLPERLAQEDRQGQQFGQDLLQVLKAQLKSWQVHHQARLQR